MVLLRYLFTFFALPTLEIWHTQNKTKPLIAIILDYIILAIYTCCIISCMTIGLEWAIGYYLIPKTGYFFIVRMSTHLGLTAAYYFSYLLIDLDADQALYFYNYMIISLFVLSYAAGVPGIFLLILFFQYKNTYVDLSYIKTFMRTNITRPLLSYSKNIQDILFGSLKNFQDRFTVGIMTNIISIPAYIACFAVLCCTTNTPFLPLMLLHYTCNTSLVHFLIYTMILPFQCYLEEKIFRRAAHTLLDNVWMYCGFIDKKDIARSTIKSTVNALLSGILFAACHMPSIFTVLSFSNYLFSFSHYICAGIFYGILHEKEKHSPNISKKDNGLGTTTALHFLNNLRYLSAGNPLVPLTLITIYIYDITQYILLYFSYTFSSHFAEQHEEQKSQLLAKEDVTPVTSYKNSAYDAYLFSVSLS